MYHPVPCFLFIPFFLARARGDRCPRQEEYRGGGGGGARGVFSSARERAKRRRRRRRGRGRVRITDGCWPAGLGATVLIMMGQAGDSCHLLWAVQKGTNCKGTRWLSLSLSRRIARSLADPKAQLQTSPLWPIFGLSSLQTLPPITWVLIEQITCTDQSSTSSGRI